MSFDYQDQYILKFKMQIVKQNTCFLSLNYVEPKYKGKKTNIANDLDMEIKEQ